MQGRGNVSGDSTKWLNFEEMQTPPRLQQFDSSEASNSLCYEQLLSVDEELLLAVDDKLLLTVDDEPSADDEPGVEMQTETIDELSTSHTEQDCGALHEDALEYISDYIIKKLKLEEFKNSENSFTWVDQSVQRLFE